MVRGPGAAIFNLSLSKKFPVGEHRWFELRGEAFNLANTPVFNSSDIADHHRVDVRRNLEYTSRAQCTDRSEFAPLVGDYPALAGFKHPETERGSEAEHMVHKTADIGVLICEGSVMHRNQPASADVLGQLGSLCDLEVPAAVDRQQGGSDIIGTQHSGQCIVDGNRLSGRWCSYRSGSGTRDMDSRLSESNPGPDARMGPNTPGHTGPFLKNSTRRPESVVVMRS